MTLTFRFDHLLAKRIDLTAKRLGLTRSEFVRRAVGRLIQSSENEQSQTAYDILKPWIGSIRSGGKFDSRNAGDQMADDLVAKYRARNAH